MSEILKVWNIEWNNKATIFLSSYFPYLRHSKAFMRRTPLMLGNSEEISVP